MNLLILLFVSSTAALSSTSTANYANRKEYHLCKDALPVQYLCLQAITLPSCPPFRMQLHRCAPCLSYSHQCVLRLFCTS
ncbi:hypothetical protein BC835DRAFT_1351871 [Cytidiella melzeri]|nr:hypothetical protein BC835DRAFT_1351871 [Cytidiella melzeri]